jgi:hypothetical protein
MQIEKYQTETDNKRLSYSFLSIGEKTIKKVVEYTKLPKYWLIENGLPIDADVYNLAFGDENIGEGDFSDLITSNNGDTDKVLATVADTAFNFWEYYPNAFIFFEGSHPEGEEHLRNYLYRRKIERFLDEITHIADVYGRIENQLESFTKGKNYNAFLIIRKR